MKGNLLVGLPMDWECTLQPMAKSIEANFSLVESMGMFTCLQTIPVAELCRDMYKAGSQLHAATHTVASSTATTWTYSMLLYMVFAMQT